MNLPSKFDLLELAHLESLVRDKISEGKYIDYKLDLPTNNDSSKKEFLADVSSFANTEGGWLIYGIQENKGVALQALGVDCENPDSELARLEDLIRNGLDPKLSRYNAKVINVKASKYIFIFKIDRSWFGPHVVNYAKRWRFYKRRNTGKYPLDLNEVRNAFLSSATSRERIDSFVRERIRKIVSDETPLPLRSEKRIILHLMPVTAFDFTIQSPLDIDIANIQVLPMLDRYGDSTPTPNFDGYVAYNYLGSGIYESYTQLYSNGVIEAVNGYTLSDISDAKFRGYDYIPSQVLEEVVISSLTKFSNLFKRLNIVPPIYVCLSLVGVRNHIMAYSSMIAGPHHQITIDRDILISQPAIIDDLSCNTLPTSRFLLDQIWRASGWSRSPNFTDNNEYMPRE